jgi:hypothetical protein
MGVESKPGLVRDYLGRWLGIDPAGARQWLDQVPDSDETTGLLSIFLGTIAERDIKAAVETAMGMDEVGSDAYSELFARWVEQAPEDAEKYVLALSEGPNRDMALEGLADSFSQQDPAAMSQFIQRLSNQEDRHLCIEVLGRTWMGVDRPATLSWLKTLTPDELKQAAPTVLGPWALDAPQEAAEFAKDNPVGPEVYGTICAAWVTRDEANKAYEWINSLPRGEERDAALLGAALTGDSHTDAVQLIQAMDNTPSEATVELLLANGADGSVSLRQLLVIEGIERVWSAGKGLANETAAH